MTKQEAHAILLECAHLYDDNLSGYNLLFLYQDGPHKVSAFEAAFYPGNFLHLTGAKLSATSRLNASTFLSACLSNRLRLTDWEFAADGTTPLKLKVLPYLMQRHLSARMLGIFNQQTMSLLTDKVVGSQNRGCMGFVMDDSGAYFAPNTVLNVDIRNITAHPQKRILLTLNKPIAASLYENIVYKAKGVILTADQLSNDLKARIPAVLL